MTLILCTRLPCSTGRAKAGRLLICPAQALTQFGFYGVSDKGRDKGVGSVQIDHFFAQLTQAAGSGSFGKGACGSV